MRTDREVFATSYPSWIAAFAGLLGVILCGASCTFPDPTFNDATDAGAGLGDGQSRDVVDANLVNADGGPGAGEDLDAGSDADTVPDAPDAEPPTCPGKACGEPRFIAQGQGEVLSVAVDGDAAFWINWPSKNDWAHLRYAEAKPGGQSGELYKTLSDSSRSLALDSETVFFGKSLANGGGVFATPRKSTGEPERLIPQNNTTVVLTDAMAVLYEASNGVASVPKGGGARRELAPSGSHLLAVHGDFVIVLERPATGARRLLSVKKDGTEAFSNATVVLEDAPEIDSLVVDESAFYFAVEDEGKIYRLGHGQAHAVAIARDEARPCTLRSDSRFLYWVTEATKDLRAMQKNGGERYHLGDAVVSALAVSAGKVAWGTPSGDIMLLETTQMTHGMPGN